MRVCSSKQRDEIALAQQEVRQSDSLLLPLLPLAPPDPEISNLSDVSGVKIIDFVPPDLLGVGKVRGRGGRGRARGAPVAVAEAGVGGSSAEGRGLGGFQKHVHWAGCGLLRRLLLAVLGHVAGVARVGRGLLQDRVLRLEIVEDGRAGRGLGDTAGGQQRVKGRGGRSLRGCGGGARAGSAGGRGYHRKAVVPRVACRLTLRDSSRVDGVGVSKVGEEISLMPLRWRRGWVGRARVAHQRLLEGLDQLMRRRAFGAAPKEVCILGLKLRQLKVTKKERKQGKEREK